MDDILAAALTMERLKNYRYEIALGKRGQRYDISLSFYPDNFFHLTGLHKLDDLEQLRSGKRAWIYQDILSGDITDDFLRKSTKFLAVEGRIKAFSYLEELLDGNRLYFRYDPRKKAFSTIVADYLISGEVGDMEVYLFLSEDTDGTYYCKSCFPHTEIDFAQGLTKYTLLQKVKVNLETEERETQFSRL